MQVYFRLQFTRVLRFIEDWGIHPFLGIPLLIFSFLLGSYYLFKELEYARLVYGVVALYFSFSLGELKRNSFIKMLFSVRQYKQVRLLENLIIASPFVAFMGYKMYLIESVSVWVLSGLIALIPAHKSYIPQFKTPFGRWPFEFAVGFRKLFFVYLLAVFVVYKAIEVGNFNLGLFGMEIVFVISILYYFNPEPVFYVWIHKKNTKSFLAHKVGIAVLYSSLLAWPLAGCLTYFFSGKLIVIAGFMLLGYGYLITVILAKYASFPKNISLPQMIIIGFSLYYPIIIIAVIPALFIHVSNRLKTYLK